MSRVSVLGAGGQVGRELVRADASGLVVTGLTHAQLDVTDGAAVFAALGDSDLVINCAAYTAVDRAESETALAFAVNRDGCAAIAEACAGRHIPLIHVSTDFVFDGTAARAWREDDPVAPINLYGASKAAGEAIIRDLLAEHVVLRTSWVFGALGDNFVRTIRRLATAGQPLRVVDDQLGCPTPAADLAEAILVIAATVLFRRSGWGTYHYAGRPAVTWADFADAIIESSFPWNARPVVQRISSVEVAAPAKRPSNSVLDCTRIGAAFGIPPADWTAGLSTVIAEMDQLERQSS